MWRMEDGFLEEKENSVSLFFLKDELRFHFIPECRGTIFHVLYEPVHQ